MRRLLHIVPAAVVTVGLTVAGHEVWPLMEDEIKGTFVSDFKYLPIILVFFLMLSVFDIIASWIERMFSRRSDAWPVRRPPPVSSPAPTS